MTIKRFSSVVLEKADQSVVYEEATRSNGIKRTDKSGEYIKPEAGLIVKFSGEYVKITRLSKNPRKVYYKKSNYNENYIVDISLLSYDAASALKFKDAFNL